MVGFFKSFSKSKKIRRISKALSKPITSSSDLLFNNSKDQALEQLLDLCESDQNVNRVIKHHGISREDLKSLYNILNAFGAGQWVSAHYVSASALCYATTLDYLLRKLEKGSLPAEAAYRVVKYFVNGETGPIES